MSTRVGTMEWNDRSFAIELLDRAKNICRFCPETKAATPATHQVVFAAAISGGLSPTYAESCENCYTLAAEVVYKAYFPTL